MHHPIPIARQSGCLRRNYDGCWPRGSSPQGSRDQHDEQQVWRELSNRLSYIGGLVKRTSHTRARPQGTLAKDAPLTYSAILGYSDWNAVCAASLSFSLAFCGLSLLASVFPLALVGRYSSPLVLLRSALSSLCRLSIFNVLYWLSRPAPHIGTQLNLRVDRKLAMADAADSTEIKAILQEMREI